MPDFPARRFHPLNTPRDTAGDPIEALLVRLRGELRRAIAGRLGWRLAAVFASAIWLAILLDRTFEPSGRVRLVCGGIVGAGVFVWLAFVAAPRVLRPIRDRDLLTLLNRTRPREVALIATALDLRRGAEAEGSRLAERTIRNAEEAARSLGETSVTRKASESGWPWFAAVAMAGLVTLAIARGDLAAAFARRFALSEAPWPRRVELLARGFRYDAPTGVWIRHAPRGEPIEVEIAARVMPGETPPRTVWSRGGGSAIRLTALTRVGTPESGTAGVTQRFRRRLERLEEDQSFTLWGGDGKIRLRLVASERPRLVDLLLISQPPSYLGAAPAESSIATLDTLPEGSRVTIRGRSTRSLEDLTLLAQGTGSSPTVVEEIRLLEEGHAFEAVLPPLREGVLVTLSGTDVLGLESEPTEVPLDFQADRPPTVSLALDGVGRAITRDAVVGVTLRVDDDHGLESASLRLESNGQQATIDLVPPRGLPGEISAEADLLSMRSSGTSRLALKVGDRLRLSSRVRDGYDLNPREPTLSQPIDLEVVTPGELLASLGESQRQLRASVEGLRSDAERLAYEIDLGGRRLEEAAADSADEENFLRWVAERTLDARKASRGVSEAAERADKIRRQVVANRLEQPALLDRLKGSVIGPLRRAASKDLAEAERLLSGPGDGEAIRASGAASRRAAESLARVAASLDSQQTYNEVVSLLRGLIREQRRVNERTSKQQSERARGLFD